MPNKLGWSSLTSKIRQTVDDLATCVAIVISSKIESNNESLIRGGVVFNFICLYLICFLFLFLFFDDEIITGTNVMIQTQINSKTERFSDE